MKIQFLSKSSNWQMLALVVAAAAVTGGIGYYGISQFKNSQAPPAKELAAPPVQQVVALGELEPQTEVMKISVPGTLSND
jgi:HlyD family secretion protein